MGEGLEAGVVAPFDGGAASNGILVYVDDAEMVAHACNNIEEEVWWSSAEGQAQEVETGGVYAAVCHTATSRAKSSSQSCW